MDLKKFDGVSAVFKATPFQKPGKNGEELVLLIPVTGDKGKALPTNVVCKATDIPEWQGEILAVQAILKYVPPREGVDTDRPEGSLFIHDVIGTEDYSLFLNSEGHIADILGDVFLSETFEKKVSDIENKREKALAMRQRLTKRPSTGVSEKDLADVPF